MTSVFRLPSRLSRHSFSLSNLFLRPASPAREFSLSKFPLLDSNQKLEEGSLSWYSPGSFYTVKIGEVFQSRYQVIGTLGYGDHAGETLIRKALDDFQITSTEGGFHCLVHPPLGMSLYDFHSDIQEKNIVMGIEDMSILTDRAVYASRHFRKTKQHGRPILCDFGQARFGSNTYFRDIQPYIYRAPKVLLRICWNEKVDIWNVGVLAWDLFQQGNLFYARDSDKKSSDAHHLAEMIAIVGPPPKEMIKNSTYATEFFDSDGNWKGAVDIPPVSLEKLEGNLEGEQQQLFLQFLRKMLKWQPEKRESARDLLDDYWLRST
ncbi:kinase-like domain-containing protein [Aspergillus heterothallicus]